MSKVLGLCSVCGKPASNTCKLCGKLVCDEHFDSRHMMCATHRAASKSK